ncbi:MAG: hypothetical protein WC444_01065 [Candidatus Paceibacterota bacterium]
MIKEYIEYLKDNPKKLWFKRKLYGWGWTPATWQGWLAIFVYVELLVGLSLIVDKNAPAREVLFTFIVPVALLTAGLIRICYVKGDKPKWQWGFSKEDK